MSTIQERSSERLKHAESPYARVNVYLNALISYFTGGGLEDVDYPSMRSDLLNNPDYNGMAPKFLKTCRDTGALWSFAKSVDPSWEPRRHFLREQFEPLLDHLEFGVSRPSPQMPGPYDSSAWTGIHDARQRLKAVQSLIPVARAAVGALIEHLEAPNHNGAPPLDEVSEALEHLRKLHSKLGELLDAADEGQLASPKGEGIVMEAARYGRRAAKSLKHDPLPYALSGILLAVFTACGFPGLGGYLGGMALAVKKAGHDQR